MEPHEPYDACRHLTSMFVFHENSHIPLHVERFAQCRGRLAGKRPLAWFIRYAGVITREQNDCVPRIHTGSGAYV